MARGTWVAAFLARKLGSLITWRFSTAKFPASRLEMLNRGILLLSVLKVLVWIFVLFMEKKVAKRKSLPFQHSAVTQGTISQQLKFTCHCLVPSILLFAFCSANERLAVISQISDHHSSGGYTVFHVWSPPVWNYELLYPVSLILCTCFAMSHVPFVRLCRGFVGRQLVKPIVTRSMASARKNKVLVTRSVPQAAIEIIKSSHR